VQYFLRFTTATFFIIYSYLEWINFFASYLYCLHSTQVGYISQHCNLSIQRQNATYKQILI